MSEFRARYSSFLILLSLLFLSGVILTPANGDGKPASEGDGAEQWPNMVERAIGLTDAGVKSTEHGKPASKGDGAEQMPNMVERAIGITDAASRMRSVKSWIKLAWINLRSPDSGYGEGGLKEQQVNPVEWAMGIPGFNSRWDTIRTWANAWSNLPSPDSRHANTDSSTVSSTGGVVKEAATKSFKASKETVEHAAASAAKAAGEVVKKTKEKVKKTAYSEREL